MFGAVAMVVAASPLLLFDLRQVVLVPMLAPVAALLLLAAAADSRRKVSWFNSAGGWVIGTDGLNFSAWLAAHGPKSPSPVITGTQPCCGCWGVSRTACCSSWPCQRGARGHDFLPF